MFCPDCASFGIQKQNVPDSNGHVSDTACVNEELATAFSCMLTTHNRGALEFSYLRREADFLLACEHNHDKVLPLAVSKTD